jgi:ParB family chromosome partitioning protein
MAESRNNLGRGLAALFGEEGEDYAALDKVRTTKDVRIEQIHPNPKQPRQNFDDATVKELAQSIQQNGILQPILVRRHPERPQEFEIIAGERRWRAAQLARLHEVDRKSVV